jgi:2,4-dienoyl-CoA reductase-like NADH-dependent reductase (Old Yellow Enzyme family)
MKFSKMITELQKEPEVQQARSHVVTDQIWEDAKRKVDRLPELIESVIKTYKSAARKTSSANFDRISIPMGEINGFECDFVCYEPNERGDQEGKRTKAFYSIFNGKTAEVYQRVIV